MNKMLVCNVCNELGCVQTLVEPTITTINTMNLMWPKFPYAIALVQFTLSYGVRTLHIQSQHHNHLSQLWNTSAGISLRQRSYFFQIHAQKWDAGTHFSSIFKFLKTQKHYTLLERIENATASIERGVKGSFCVHFFFVLGFWCVFFFFYYF